MQIHRATVLALAAFAGLSACRSAAPKPTEEARAQADVSAQLGLQLYSFRKAMKEDLDGTLAKVAAMGFKEIEVPELYGLTAEELRAKIESHGMHVRSMMSNFDRLEAQLDAVVADAQAIGADFVVCPWIPHEDGFDTDDMNRALTVFNRAGAALKTVGVRFAYHMHGYEFQAGPNGKFYFDQMVEQTTPGEVDFEMDVYWVVSPGADPVAYLKRYPGRFPLLHLKDMRKGVPTGKADGKGNVEDNVVLGTGQIDFPAIMAAAQAQGAKWYFIEDESSRAMEAVPQSVAYLKTLRF